MPFRLKSVNDISIRNHILIQIELKLLITMIMQMKFDLQWIFKHITKLKYMTLLHVKEYLLENARPIRKQSQTFRK